MHIRILVILALLAFGAVSLAPLAQEERAPAPAEPAVEDEEAAANEPPVEEETANDDDWEIPALPDDFLEDDVFVPTEEIEADEEVTFPVNI